MNWKNVGMMFSEMSDELVKWQVITGMMEKELRGTWVVVVLASILGWLFILWVI